MSWRWVPVSGAYTASTLEAAGLVHAFDDQATAEGQQQQYDYTQYQVSLR